MPRRTKIVATLGPASSSDAALDALVRAGMDVARLNLSHGQPEEHLGRLQAVRAASERAGRPVGVLADLPGPKVRAGQLPEGGMYLMEGEQVRLMPGDGPSSPHHISVDYPSLLEDVRPGDVVTLGDGTVSLVVVEADGERLTTRVLNGARIQGRPGVHLPVERLRLNAVTPKDLELLAIMGEAGVDFVAVSFVRSAADVRQVQVAAGEGGPMVIAKIETGPAVRELGEILEVADGVMVARGDLGIALPMEDVPHVQKRVIRSCVEAGVPVITATQMLESMTNAPMPTRAEVSDVANAVMDGTDAVMLSGETAIGVDPAGVVATMARIAQRAEEEVDDERWGREVEAHRRGSRSHGPTGLTHAICHAGWLAAREVGASAIVACTRSGITARAIARFRPEERILAVSADPRTVRQLTLTWGVTPLTVALGETTEQTVWLGVEATVQHGFAGPGDLVAVLAGAVDSAEGATDVLRLIRIH